MAASSPRDNLRVPSTCRSIHQRCHEAGLHLDQGFIHRALSSFAVIALNHWLVMEGFGELFKGSWDLHVAHSSFTEFHWRHESVQGELAGTNMLPMLCQNTANYEIRGLCKTRSNCLSLSWVFLASSLTVFIARGIAKCGHYNGWG